MLSSTLEGVFSKIVPDVLGALYGVFKHLTGVQILIFGVAIVVGLFSSSNEQKQKQERQNAREFRQQQKEERYERNMRLQERKVALAEQRQWSREIQAQRDVMARELFTLRTEIQHARTELSLAKSNVIEFRNFNR